MTSYDSTKWSDVPEIPGTYNNPGTNIRPEPEPPPQGGIPENPCSCTLCRNNIENLNQRIIDLEVAVQYLQSADTQVKRQATISAKLDTAFLPGEKILCGCYPVEWNPHNKAVCCHVCGRQVPIPKAKIVYDEGGA